MTGFVHVDFTVLKYFCSLSVHKFFGSKVNCFRRFDESCDSIQEFLMGKELGQAVTPMKNDCFYLANIFEKLNSINRELYGQNSDLITCKRESNIGRLESSHFPMLIKVSNNISDNDLEVLSI